MLIRSAIVAAFALSASATIAQSAPEEKGHPEVQCVQERVLSTYKQDISARLLAAQIVDRCSELIKIEMPDCAPNLETIDGAICRRQIGIMEDARRQISAALYNPTYNMIVDLRQSQQK